MKSKEFRSFLKSLDLTPQGFVIDSVGLEKDGSYFAHCSMKVHRTQGEQEYGLYVIWDDEGQVIFTLNFLYPKGGTPDIFSAALVELCNELNGMSVDCCAKLEFHPEREGEKFNVLVSMSFKLPQYYLRRKSGVAKELYELNLLQFLLDTDYYYYEMKFMVDRLSETGLFDDDVVDAEGGVLPGERR